MTKAGDKIIESLEEAARIAKGEIPAARLFHNGHYYVPEEIAVKLWKALEEAKLDLDLMPDSSSVTLRQIYDALDSFTPPSA